ncbi:MAG: guanylate kinase, partial [Cycloclasticus sp.]|nr:guanylate kinase [Cycloclasticus sp.]
QVMADCCSIFVLPPSKPILEERLRGRGQDSDEVINKRMRTAVDEMSHYDEYEFLVINDDFDVALNALTGIVQSKRLGLRRAQLVHSTLLNQLLK